MPDQTPKLPALTALEVYLKALAAHDWHFDFSDDRRARAAGAESLKRLEAMQRELDPGYWHWNQHCPLVYRRFQPAPSSLVFDPKAHFDL